MDISMEELFAMLEDNADRLEEVQSMISDRQDGMLIQPKPDDTIASEDASKNDIRKD